MTPVTLSPRGATRAVGAVLLLIAGGHAAGLVSTHLFGHGRLLGLVPLFNLDREANVATWFASSLLLVNALLLGVVGWARRQGGEPFARHWLGLSLVFVFLSLDEAAQVHELLNSLRTTLGSSGMLYWPWVVVYGALLVVLGIAYLRFLAALPRPTRKRFLLAGAVYVAGALGGEMVGAPLAEAHGMRGLAFAMAATAEELLELTGQLLFLYALLAYARVEVAVGLAAAAGAPVLVAPPAAVALARDPAG